MVIRVFNLERETKPSFTAYIDPWAMYLARKLDFLAEYTYLVALHPGNTTIIVEED